MIQIISTFGINTFFTGYMTQMLDEPELVRNVAMVGALHSGKTAFCDCLWEMTHKDCFQLF